MADGIVLSKQGVYFSYEAIDTMRHFLKSVQQEASNATISWSVAFGKDGELIIGLGGEYKPFDGATQDEVDGVVFYWYAEPKGINAVKGCCIDVGMNRRSRVIDLPNKDFVS